MYYGFQFISVMFQVGDGTTSVILLAVEFLRQIKPLVEENVHPQILIKGFRKATKLVSFVILEFDNSCRTEVLPGETSVKPSIFFHLVLVIFLYLNKDNLKT